MIVVAVLSERAAHKVTLIYKYTKPNTLNATTSQLRVYQVHAVQSNMSDILEAFIKAGYICKCGPIKNNFRSVKNFRIRLFSSIEM